MRKLQRGGANWLIVVIILALAGFFGYTFFLKTADKTPAEGGGDAKSSLEERQIKEMTDMATREGGIYHVDSGVTFVPFQASVIGIDQQGQGRPGAKFLSIQLSLTNFRIIDPKNPQADRTVNYQQWQPDETKLVDDQGNTYARAETPAMIIMNNAPAGPCAVGKPWWVTMVFEPPTRKDIKWLKLTLPAANVGGSGMIELTIPGEKLKFF